MSEQRFKVGSFSVGDRVRVVDSDPLDSEKMRIGLEGVVSRYETRLLSYPISVDFDAGFSERVRSDQIEHVTPQVFKLPVPEEPPVGSRVRSVAFPRLVYGRSPVGWFEVGGISGRTWFELLSEYRHGGLELVPDDPEEDYQASLFYLRRNVHLLDALEADGITGSHAATVVRHVLACEGSPLAGEGGD